MTEHESVTELGDIASTWWLLAVLAALSVVTGIIVLVQPSIALGTLAVIAGVLFLVDGLFEVIASLLSARERSMLGVILGAASVIIGVILVRHPTHAVVAVALLVGLWLIVSGMVRFAAGLHAEGRLNRLWTLAVAVVEAIAGIVIVSSPGIGVATLALFIGISLLVRGVVLLGAAWVLYSLRGVQEVSETPHRPVTAS